jgi:hypothetical protein
MNDAIRKALEEYAALYPPYVTVPQAAAIAARCPRTIYDWSSQGRFDGFKVRTGREIRLNRDALVLFLFGDKP